MDAKRPLSVTVKTLANGDLALIFWQEGNVEDVVARLPMTGARALRSALSSVTMGDASTFSFDVEAEQPATP